jgi:hypothetical protein
MVCSNSSSERYISARGALRHLRDILSSGGVGFHELNTEGNALVKRSTTFRNITEIRRRKEATERKRRESVTCPSPPRLPEHHGRLLGHTRPIHPSRRNPRPVQRYHGPSDLGISCNASRFLFSCSWSWFFFLSSLGALSDGQLLTLITHTSYTALSRLVFFGSRFALACSRQSA